MKYRHILIGVLLLLFALALTACSSSAPPADTTPCPEAPACPDCPEAPACPDCPEAAPCPEAVVDPVPYEEEWVSSGHADADAEAFRHWDEDDPKEVPTSCAKCHSTYGMVDFLGADGSTPGEVNAAAPVDSTVECVACHNDVTLTKSSVVFPSGAEVTGLGGEAICMECHQGRASKLSVDGSLEELGLTEDLDTANADLGFINIHYYPAGATLYGTQAMGGYEYDGKMYDGKFRHVEGIDTCVGCHNQHSLEVRLEVCQECHEGADSLEALKETRMLGSLADYNGNGDVTEGINAELEGLQAMLLQGMQSYANEVAGTAIAYSPAAYPYFFIDGNGDGEVGDDEANNDNRYNAWTGRLLKAAYNYQMSAKDPGKFAHNAKYMVQLMYDSIEDLNTVLATPVDLSTAHRQDPGHFAGNTEAFRHWDEEGEVPGSCARCHSADGLPTFIHNNANIATETANGFMCTTCHDEENWPARYLVDEVTFPSGATVTFGEGEDGNLCMLCHQGRSSTSSVNRALADKAADTPDETIRFSNIHYFAAGATLFGNEVQGAYQFDGKEYVGTHPHVTDLGFTCKNCHDVHALEVKVEVCTACHSGASDPNDPDTYRIAATDWNGNGDTEEGVKAEIATFGERLYAGMQAYAAAAGTPIVYDSLSYPYFFVDADEDGEPDAGESGLVGYNAFSPNLLRAAYNYQYWQKDPGNFAHNAPYMMQILYDSIQAVGGDTAGLTRP
jgi:hypothetical protein